MAAIAAVWNSKKPHRNQSKMKVKLKIGTLDLFIGCLMVVFLLVVVCCFFLFGWFVVLQLTKANLKCFCLYAIPQSTRATIKSK